MAQLVGNFKLTAASGRSFYTIGSVALNATSYTVIQLHELTNNALESLIAALEANILESNDTDEEEIRSLINNTSLDVDNIEISDIEITSIAPGDNNIGNVDIVTMPNVTLNELPAGNNNIGNVDVVSLPALAAGTNNIGDVDVVSLPNVTLNALPAGTNNIGDVDVLSLPALPAGANNIGSVNVANFPLTQGVADTVAAGLITNLLAKFPLSAPDYGNESIVPQTNGTLKVFTADDVTNVFTSTSHGYVNGDPVHLTTDGTLPAPLTSTTTSTATPPVTSDTIYYVGEATSDTFKLFAYNSATAINITNAGTGTHSVQKRGRYTGTWKDVSEHGSILAFYLQDAQLSGPSAGVLEWSNDGINIVSSSFATTVLPQQIVAVTVPFPTTYYIGLVVVNGTGFAGKYYRVRLINGASNPNFVFALARVSKHPSSGSITTINDPLNQFSVAQLVRSVNAGVDPNDQFINIRAQGRDRKNSTIAPLAANGVYRGKWFPWQQNYIKLLTDLSSDVAGTLYIDFSQAEAPADDVDTDMLDSIPMPYDPVLEPLLRRTTIVQSKWVRHRYINGVAAQSVFGLDAAFSITDPGVSTQALSVLPTPKNQVGMMRVVPAIINAAGTGYQEMPVDPLGIPKTRITGIDDDIQIRPNEDELFTQMVIGTTPTRLDPSQLPNRRQIRIVNHGPGKIAIGNSDQITFDSGSNRFNVDGAITYEMSPAKQRWAIVENTGGTQTVLSRSPSSGSGTATNPNNVLLSNDTYANITTGAQTVTATGYTAGTANALVTVRLGMEAKKQSGQFETGTFQEVQTGNSATIGSVTSVSLAGGTAMTYVASISRESLATVTSVTGLGLTWSLVRTAQDTSNTRSLDMWIGYGTATTGTVVATFSTTVSAAHISVVRYSNIDQVAPIQAHSFTTGTTVNVTGPTLAGTNKGNSILAVAINNATSTPGVGYNERSDERGPGTSNTADGLTVLTKPLTLTTTEAGTATLNQAENWVAIGLTLSPATAINPVVNLSYLFSAVPGATSGNITLSSTSDTTSYVNVTPDRAWVVGNIPNVDVKATGSTVGAASADIDHLFLELTDTTGNTSRVSIWQAGAVTS